MKCPKCQVDNPEIASFCADCGTKLLSLKGIEVTETMETAQEELATGSTFAGRYQIIEELGKIDPIMDPLRDNPRFKRLLKQGRS